MILYFQYLSFEGTAQSNYLVPIEQLKDEQVRGMQNQEAIGICASNVSKTDKQN